MKKLSKAIIGMGMVVVCFALTSQTNGTQAGFSAIRASLIKTLKKPVSFVSNLNPYRNDPRAIKAVKNDRQFPPTVIETQIQYTTPDQSVEFAICKAGKCVVVSTDDQTLVKYKDPTNGKDVYLCLDTWQGDEKLDRELVYFGQTVQNALVLDKETDPKKHALWWYAADLPQKK